MVVDTDTVAGIVVVDTDTVAEVLEEEPVAALAAETEEEIVVVVVVAVSKYDRYCVATSDVATQYLSYRESYELWA